MLVHVAIFVHAAGVFLVAVVLFTVSRFTILADTVVAVPSFRNKRPPFLVHIKLTLAGVERAILLAAMFVASLNAGAFVALVNSDRRPLLQLIAFLVYTACLIHSWGFIYVYQLLKDEAIVTFTQIKISVFIF